MTMTAPAVAMMAKTMVADAMRGKGEAAAILRIEARAAAVAAAAAMKGVLEEGRLQLEVAESTMEWNDWQFGQ